MIIKRLLSLLAVAIVTFTAAAQDDVEFTADRPGASTGPGTIGKGVVQLEQGVQWDGEDASGTFTFSSTLLRYGLFDGMELRLGGDALIYNDNGWKPAFTGLTLGTKIKCYEGKGAIPAISLLANISIPKTGNEGFVVEHLAPSIYLLFENPVNDWLSIGYNVGAEWNGSNQYPSTFVALCLGFSITENLGCFAESYNYFSKLGNGYFADFGFNYMVAPRVQLDLAANINVCNPKSCWAVSCGVAWQINNPK